MCDLGVEVLDPAAADGDADDEIRHFVTERRS
jgi:hypothetical protein